MANNENGRDHMVPKDNLIDSEEGLVSKGQISAETVDTAVDEIASKADKQAEAVLRRFEKDSFLGAEVKKELSPEKIEEYLGELKARFNAFPELHDFPGRCIEWSKVEKALRADPESLKRLHALDKKGHAMNVFGENLDGEYIFASAWEDINEVSKDHRNICFDPEGQKIAESNGRKPNGNAVSIIAALMGVDDNEAHNYLADRYHDRHLRNYACIKGWAYLRTDDFARRGIDLRVIDDERKSRRFADCGDNGGFFRNSVDLHDAHGSFRAVLLVKKS